MSENFLPLAMVMVAWAATAQSVKVRVYSSPRVKAVISAVKAREEASVWRLAEVYS